MKRRTNLYQTLIQFIAFGCILFGASLLAAAQRAGTLDAGFGSGGKVTTDAGNNGMISALLTQQDGKIIACGHALNGTNDLDFTLARYNIDGSLDTSFGSMGIAKLNFTYRIINGSQRGSRDTAVGAAYQSNGKIVVAGMTQELHQNNEPILFALARFNADGSVDTTFGDAGTVRVGVGNFALEGFASAMAIQPDNKIVMVGTARAGLGFDFATVRFNPDGSLDSTFGSGGKVYTHFLGNDSVSHAYAVAIQPGGKILVGGRTRWFHPDGVAFGGLAFARYNPDGSPDSSFNGGGSFYLNLGNNNDGTGSQIEDIEVLPDGKFIIGGHTAHTGSSNTLIARFNINGTLDSSFGTGGYTSQFAAGGVGVIKITNVERLPDGKYLLAQPFSNGPGLNVDFLLARYNANGSLDTSFGNAGSVTTNFYNGNDIIRAVALHPNGKVTVGGQAYTTPYTSFALARYNLGLANASRPQFDYDGDGKADISVFRPSEGTWFRLNSSNDSFLGMRFGISEDLIAPADFDGDGRTDISVFRPSAGTWYRINSSTNLFTAVRFGSAGDIPVPSDFDGDGKADTAVFRPSTGDWYRLNSSDNQFVAVHFGTAGDKPQVGDFDGDGKSDLVVFRPSSEDWYFLFSLNGAFTGTRFGISQDIPAPADYDGDGRTDIAVYRPSEGVWYRLNSSNNQFIAARFGIAEDKPTPADFDGDGKADIGVFRPSAGTWYLLRSTQGFLGLQFGTNGDVPTPAAFGQ